MKKILFAFAVIIGGFTGVAHAANNCTGATYYDSNTDTCIACPNGYDYNTDAGKTDVTQCQIHCDGGTYVETGGVLGYTQLEYIESTGSQRIDTGIVINTASNSIEQRIGFGYSQLPGTRQLSGGSGNGNDYWGVYPSGGNVFFEVYKKGTYPIQPNTMYDLNVSQRKDINAIILEANLNNTQVEHIVQSGTNFGASRLYIFSLSGGGYSMNHAKISYYQVYLDNVLVRNMIPARRNSDGVVGMYDAVTGTFFTNAGTGTFIAGSDVGSIGKCANVGAGYYAPASAVNFGSVGTRTQCPAGTYSNVTNASSCTPCANATYNDETGMASCKSCPAGYDYNQDAGKTDITQCQIHCDGGTYVETAGIVGYTQLGYIESSGRQWVDTGVTFNSNIGYEFEYQPITTNNFVTQAGTTGQVIAQSGNVWEFRFNGSTNRRPNPATIDLTKFVNIKYNIDNKCSVDDKIVDISDLTLNNAGSIRLFGPNYNSSGRMKFFKVYDNGILVNNLVPVRRNSDNIVGMYDTVTETFFTNSGTGEFIAGPDIIGSCENVGAGYYAPASTVNYGSVGTRTACPVGLYTVGYGHGADNANDCGRILHIGDNVIHMRRNKETTPSVNIQMTNGDMFYISLSPINHTVSRLHFQYNGNEYTAYDDSLLYGERDFDTGQQISQ